jgi:peptide-methionine (S)-S-oxide reductase
MNNHPFLSPAVGNRTHFVLVLSGKINELDMKTQTTKPRFSLNGLLTVGFLVMMALATYMAVYAGAPDGGEDKQDTKGTSDMKPTNTEKATFAAGCFWGVEAAFRQLDGVLATSVGYTGGHTDNPTYRDVCSDTTGHAEAVEVVYDPTRLTYADLLKVFWDSHDPTTLNRQGPDIGSQYRSAILVHSEEQRRQAEESKDELEKSGRFRRPIVTEIVDATTFYPAEEYHQQYLEKRGLSSCHINLQTE